MPIKDAIILDFDAYHLIDYLEFLTLEAETFPDKDINNYRPKYNYYGVIRSKKNPGAFRYLKVENPDPYFERNTDDYHIANAKYNYNILTSILASTSNKKRRDLGRVFEDNKEMMLGHMLEK